MGGCSSFERFHFLCHCAGKWKQANSDSDKAKQASLEKLKQEQQRHEETQGECNKLKVNLIFPAP